jgi:hypothetical protein
MARVSHTSTITSQFIINYVTNRHAQILVVIRRVPALLVADFCLKKPPSRRNRRRIER